MLKHDLHLHTTYSDGVRTPKEVAERALELGLEQIAISDHDSNSGVNEAIEASRGSNLEIIPSIEVGTTEIIHGKKYTDTEFLGYKSDIERMATFSLPVRKQRRQFVQDYIDTLNRINREGKLREFNDNLNQFSNDEAQGDAYMIRDGIQTIKLKDVLEDKFRRRLRDEEAESLANKVALVSYDFISYALDNFLEHPERLQRIHPKRRGYLLKDALVAWTPTSPDEYTLTHEKAIKGILDCNGIPVLAHPARNKKFLEKKWMGEKDSSKLNPEEWVKELVRHGLQGIELYFYSGNGFSKEEEVKANTYFANLADKYRLITTFGSDCHGQKDDAGELIGKFQPDYMTERFERSRL